MNQGEKYVKFIESLKIPAGKHGNKRFVLQPWQREFILTVFGTVTQDGIRQYRDAMCFLPKKNGKTTLCAAIVIAALFLENEPLSEIYSAANSREQASIVFRQAEAMVNADHFLKKQCKVLTSKKQITRKDNGSYYRALSAEAGDKNGTKAKLLVLDEIAEWTGSAREIYDKLISGTAGTSEPLTISITTAGITKGSVGYDIYKTAKEAQKHPENHPTFLPVIFEAPSDCDWSDIEVWKKCNPNWGITVEPEYAIDLIRKAKESPSEVTKILRYHLNVWVDAAQTWIPSERWTACGEKLFSEYDIKGSEAWLGVDLASTIDLAAVVAFVPLDDSTFGVIPRFYCPEETAAQRERRDRVPYLTWIRNEQLIATPGNVIDYEYIRKDIVDIGKDFNIRGIGIDRWNSTQLSTQLADQDGFRVIPFGQGSKSMTAPCKELERLITSKKILHNNNPILAWMARNIVVNMKAGGDLAPDKEKSIEKIDGIVALLMALGIYLEDGGSVGKSVYEGRGFVFL